MSGSNLLFVFTGSIAAYKACEAVSQLVQRGHRVRIVATESALKFIGPATLEGLTGTAPLSDRFAQGTALEHINLTRWADAVVICPATANTINRLAAGLADDLVVALFLARLRNKPWLVAPAMNPAMWSHPATRAAVERLGTWGVRFLSVGSGRTACGETGEGRLTEPEEIVAAVEAAVAKPARWLRVLVTSGGTTEPIDGVRVLTNTSTGYTGAKLAAQLAGGGHDVVLLRARGSVPCPPLVREGTFGTFAELDTALTRILAAEEFDAVIHAAAVGDFAVESVTIQGVDQPVGTKLDSRHPVRLDLRPQPKLVSGLRARSLNPRLVVVAFKLTADATVAEVGAEVQELLAEAAPDYVVHNDLANRGLAPDDFAADIHARHDGSVVHCATRPDLAAALERLLTATTPTP